MKTLAKATQDASSAASNWVGNNEQSINTLSNGLGVAGAALTGFAALSVKKFADFDQAMSAVQAATLASADEMDTLREAAIQAGADTAFSASEAAGAIENLAKAGVSSADILGGALTGSLDLAAAGELGVAEAAEIAATAMTQFGLAGGDVTHIADLLAAGAGKAQGDVTDLAGALKQSGLVASQFGLSIEETTGTLGAFASAGLLGSDAGTSFRSMLLRLGNPTKEAADLMAQLGINAYDAQGNFVGMVSLAGQLESALAPLPQAQRDAAMATLFGSDAIRAANVLYQQGAEGIQGWITAVDDQGYAAEQAAARLDNLKGDLEALGGSLETALIGMGEGANGPLRSLTQGATDAVNAFSALPAPVQHATLMIAGGSGLALLGVAGLGKLAIATNDAVTAMRDLGIMSEGARGRVGRLVSGAAKVAGLAAGLYATAVAFDAIASSSDKAAAGVEETSRALRGLSGNDTNSLFVGLGQDFEDMAGAMDLLFGGGINGKMERFGSSLNAIFFGGQLSDQVADAREQFHTMGVALAEMVGSGDAEQAERIFSQIAAAAEEQGYTLEQVNGLMQPYTEALAGAASAAEDALPPTQELTSSLDAQAEAADNAWDSVLDMTDGLLGLRDAEIGFEEAIDSATAAVAENGATLDITTEKGRANRRALDDIAKAGLGVVDSMRSQGATQEELRGSMERTRASFISAATAMGMSKSEANQLADSLGLIPSNVSTQVSVNGIDGALSRLGALNATLNSINGKTVTAAVAIRQYGQAAMATGGPVIGPGTGTSDDIPAMLSNGEHVLTAAEVQRMGGHAAVMRLRKAAMAGALPKFASGGPVLEPSMRMVPAPTGSATASTSSGSRTYNLTINTQRASAAQIVAAQRRLELLDY